MDRATAATAATAATVNSTARRDGTTADMADATTATMADAPATAARNSGARATATVPPGPDSPPTDVAIPTATTTATAVDARVNNTSNTRGTWTANDSKHLDNPDWTRAAARAPPLQTPANARRSTGPGGGGASARIGWGRPPRAPPTIVRGLPQVCFQTGPPTADGDHPGLGRTTQPRHCPHDSLTGPTPWQPPQLGRLPSGTRSSSVPIA